MNTLHAGQQELFWIETPESKVSAIAKGMVHVHTVQYRAYEMTDEEFSGMKFRMHNAGSQEAKIIAIAVNRPSPGSLFTAEKTRVGGEDLWSVECKGKVIGAFARDRSSAELVASLLNQHFKRK